MGKRKTEDRDKIKRKIMKLEKKLKRLPAEPEDVSPACSPPRSPPPSPEPVQPSRSPSPIDEVESPLMPPQLHRDIDTEAELPVELLLALGTEGEERTEVGPEIRAELTARWTKIMQTGLGKDSREMIIKKYPPPINFPRSVAPVMNPEMLASLSEISRKRDRRICVRQNLTGRIMTCLGKSLSSILTGNINSKILVEEINDAAKLAAEIFYQDSSSRRFFALTGANKITQEAFKNVTPDEYLFGNDCADKIKAAQSIQKTGSSIKINEKGNYSRAPAKKQVNWRGPSQQQHQQQQRGRGGPHYQQPLARQHRQEQLRRRIKKPAPNQPRSRSRYHK